MRGGEGEEQGEDSVMIAGEGEGSGMSPGEGEPGYALYPSVQVVRVLQMDIAHTRGTRENNGLDTGIMGAAR